MPEDCAISFRHATKTFTRDGKVSGGVRDVSAQARAGALVTIVGPSGSGKSTLLSLCNALLTPDDGEVHVFGKEVRQWDVFRLRRTVGLVFQTPVMFPGTVLENLSMGPKLQGKSLADPGSWLERTGLPTELLNRQAAELSGGQKQRVAFARVLANGPEVLLLDESTSALDPGSARDIENLVQGLVRDTGLTVLWVTHNLEQARRVGQDTWFLADGKLVEAKSTEQFFTQPMSTLAAEFLQSHRGGTQ